MLPVAHVPSYRSHHQLKLVKYPGYGKVPTSGSLPVGLPRLLFQDLSSPDRCPERSGPLDYRAKAALILKPGRVGLYMYIYRGFHFQPVGYISGKHILMITFTIIGSYGTRLYNG